MKTPIYFIGTLACVLLLGGGCAPKQPDAQNNNGTMAVEAAHQFTWISQRATPHLEIEYPEGWKSKTEESNDSSKIVFVSSTNDLITIEVEEIREVMKCPSKHCEIGSATGPFYEWLAAPAYFDEEVNYQFDYQKGVDKREIKVQGNTWQAWERGDWAQTQKNTTAYFSNKNAIYRVSYIRNAKEPLAGFLEDFLSKLKFSDDDSQKRAD